MMKNRTFAALLALTVCGSVPALAQAPSTAAQSPVPGKYSVDKTPIAVIWADPKAKAVLLKELPPIEMYLDLIKDMTLVQVAPQSGGEINDAKLKAIQAAFDAIN
jgi:hypothetical protein